MKEHGETVPNSIGGLISYGLWGWVVPEFVFGFLRSRGSKSRSQGKTTEETHDVEVTRREEDEVKRGLWVRREGDTVVKSVPRP